MKDVSARPAEGEKKAKPRKNKAGMEVYVPRPKRLQQPAETEKDKGNSFEEMQSNTFQDVESDKTAAGDSKELKKFRRHKVKERKALSDARSGERKDAPKSKHEKHRRSKHDQCEENTLKAEPSDHEKQVEQEHFDSNELQNNYTNISDKTWEDEMKFYDSISSDHGEMDTNVEDKPSTNTKEMFLEQTTTAAEHQDAKATALTESVDPSSVQHVAQITEANSNLSVSNNMETDSNLTEANNQICDPPVVVETFKTDKCSFSKEAVQVKDPDSDIKLCSSDIPEAEFGVDNLPPVTDPTNSEEQPYKRRKSNEGQEESRGVYDCDDKIDNKTLTTVDHNDTRACDGQTAQGEGKVQALNLEKPSETDIIVEKSTSFPTSSENTKEEINIVNDDSGDTETRMGHENIDQNDQMTHEIKVAKNPEDNQISDSCQAEDEEGDTWDSLFDDDGEALDPKLMEEVKRHVYKNAHP